MVYAVSAKRESHSVPVIITDTRDAITLQLGLPEAEVVQAVLARVSSDTPKNPSYCRAMAVARALESVGVYYPGWAESDGDAPALMGELRFEGTPLAATE